MDRWRGDGLEFFDDLPGPSNRVVKKRRVEGVKEEDDSIKALKAKIRRIEADNDKVKAERDFFQSRSIALQPASFSSSRIHTHSFPISLTLFDNAAVMSEPWQVEGLEMSVKVRQNFEMNGAMGIELTPHISMTDAGPPRLVLMTVHVGVVQGRMSSRYKEIESASTENAARGITARVFLDKPIDYQGPPETVVPSTKDIQLIRGSDYKLMLRFSAVIEKLETPCSVGDDATTVVKVKGKEFHVSQAYLSRWSLLFRDVFAAEKSGQNKQPWSPRFSDAGISAEDFAEMLLVIYPTQKPVTANNYAHLLLIAGLLEMPALTHLVERFLMDLSAHSLDKGKLYKIAADQYKLPLVQAVLLHRWQDGALLKKELITTSAYDWLKPETRILINQLYATAAEPVEAPPKKQPCRHAEWLRGNSSTSFGNGPEYSSRSPPYRFSDDDDN